MYTYTNKIAYDDIIPSWSVVIVSVRYPVYTPFRTLMYGLPLSQSDHRIRSVFLSVYNKSIIFLLVCSRLRLTKFDVRLCKRNLKIPRSGANTFYCITC